MIKEKVHKRTLKHILCCIIIVIIFALTVTFHVEAKTNNIIERDSTTEDIVPLEPKLTTSLRNLDTTKIVETKALFYDTPRIIEKNIDFYIEENIDTIQFFARVFNFEIDYIIKDLKERSNSIDIDETNISSLKTDTGETRHFNNATQGIVEYFYFLEKNFPNKVNNKIIHYNGNSEYVEKLIIYFTNIYSNVDTTTALSIGATESGYYKVKYMLSINNIYGGMGNNGLIKYKNIEYGVLSYVRYLSKNYYSKGLNNLESIGRIYCPSINEYGNKIASPHWVNLVNKAKIKYKNYINKISINEIIDY